MKTLFKVIKSRPLLIFTTLLGIAIASFLPGSLRPVTRALWGWNVGVWLFLVSTMAMMARSDHSRLRRNALLHSEGLTIVMTVAACSVAASLAAITFELSQAKPSGGGIVSWPYVLFALSTVVGSWLLLATLFALAYASRYYGRPGHPGSGLSFPGLGTDENQPHYADFMYFSLTLAATSQTSDVAITRTEIRRWVTAQAVLSFAFNTMLLALAVNIAAGLL
ncbi:MAG TPA: DUF1345 domain-containing protein [Burkholderiaceae bacterium]|nr:DUF1345 domain-containing protein [Burkholderiaceae bacterium]